MFGSGVRDVFRSRWHALVWAIGICTTAYCTVPQQGQSALGDESVLAPSAPVSEAEARKQQKELEAAIAQLGGDDKPKHPTQTKSPWAPDAAARSSPDQ